MPATIIVAVGFLVLGLAGLALTIALVANRRRWSEWVLEQLMRWPPNHTRVLCFQWDSRWGEQSFRERRLARVWLPVVASAAIWTVIAFAAAYAHA